MKVTRLEPRFIEQRPDLLEEGILYISISFRASVHLCCCGCGLDVWLPIRPNRWSLTYDGERISLSPSVGNWSFPCRSHYWIRESRVHRAREWSEEEVEAARRRTRERDLASYRGSASRWWWHRLLQGMPLL